VLLIFFCITAVNIAGLQFPTYLILALKNNPVMLHYIKYSWHCIKWE